MPIVLNGSGPITGVTSLNTTVSDTEIGYLDGVTSALQTQINTAGGLVKITDSSFTTAGSVSLNNCFTSTYANYRIILTVTGVNYDGNVYLRLRSGGTDHTTGQYYTGLAGGTSAGADSNVGQNATSLIVLMTVDAGSPGGYYCSSVDINSPQLSFHKSLSIVSSSFTTAGVYRGLAGGGALDNTSAFDGFTIGVDGPGGSTFSGHVRVYGYRN